MRHFFKVVLMTATICLNACDLSYSTVNQDVDKNKTLGSATSIAAALPPSTPNRQLLLESWETYRQRFIQSDGRVIDFEARDRSTSEGQAYAMLRAVLIDDPETFALTLRWGENNLQRQEKGKRVDNLWAWKWGRNADGSWGPIDSNFATDGDIDAITALIFAARRWNRPEYLQLAKVKLQDLWNFGTFAGLEGKRYLLPGPTSAFVNDTSIILNPSYLAPYAFRLFAQVDPERDWLSLVDTSYEILANSTELSPVKLPSDWIALNTKTGEYQLLPPSSPLQSVYSFDAYRVWWRLSLDLAWFNSERAQRYLQTSTQHLKKLWRERSRIPARIDLQGNGLVEYEATSQYAMLYAAWQIVDPQLADELAKQKLLSQYKQGIWDDKSAYYTQNLAWLGLLPPSVIPPDLLNSK